MGEMFLDLLLSYSPECPSLHGVGWALKKNQVDEKSSEYNKINILKTFLHYEEPLGHISPPTIPFSVSALRSGGIFVSLLLKFQPPIRANPAATAHHKWEMVAPTTLLQ